MTQKSSDFRSSDFDSQVLDIVKKQQAGFDTIRGIAQALGAEVLQVSSSIKRLRIKRLVFYNKGGRFWDVV